MFICLKGTWAKKCSNKSFILFQSELTKPQPHGGKTRKKGGNYYQKLVVCLVQSWFYCVPAPH